MKGLSLLILCVYVMFCNSVFTQNHSGVFYEITIINPQPGIYSNKIQFQKEGLLLWNNKRIKEYIENDFIFIPIKEVGKHLRSHGQEISKLFTFIKDEKIMEMSDVLAPDFIDISDITDEKIRANAIYLNKARREDLGYMTISIRDLVANKYNYFIYDYGDSRIDELLSKVNELIPHRYRKQLEIKSFRPH